MIGGDSREIVLALDAAGWGCSVAVANGDEVLGVERLESRYGQAEALLPMVDRSMRKAGLPPKALDIVAATVGPGSFTGIRVGLAAARGIALAGAARLVGVTSFDATAARVIKPDEVDASVLVALESRRDDLYIQFFDSSYNPISYPAAVMPVLLADAVNAVIGETRLLIAGDAAERAALALSRRPAKMIVETPEPGAVGATRAALRLARQDRADDTARALYLRPPDVTLSNGGSKPSTIST